MGQRTPTQAVTSGAVDPTGTYGFTYDNLGRLTQTATNYSFLASRTLTVNYTYDAGSNRLTMSGPETGPATSYVYDTLNRLTSLTDFNNVPFGLSYDALGRRTGLTRANGFNTTYTYDVLSRLLSVVHQKGSSTLGASYTYDAAGNRSSKTDLALHVNSTYTYDAIYELTQAAQGATTTESYSYDAVGNRLSSLSVPSYTYNASNQLLSSGGVTWGYDANGSVSSRTDSHGTITGTWDFENRGVRETLPNGATVNFKYDPFGRRIQKSSASGTTIYVYDGDNVVDELDQNGNSVARYTQSLGIDEPLAMYRSGAGFAYHADGLGSIGGLTDANGNGLRFNELQRVLKCLQECNDRFLGAFRTSANFTITEVVLTAGTRHTKDRNGDHRRVRPSTLRKKLERTI